MSYKWWKMFISVLGVGSVFVFYLNFKESFLYYFLVTKSVHSV